MGLAGFWVVVGELLRFLRLVSSEAKIQRNATQLPLEETKVATETVLSTFLRGLLGF